MEPDQSKLTQKTSSRESEVKKRRASLFPIRNSARRKSSMCQSHNVFDPHSAQHSSNRIAHNSNQDNQLNCRDCKSETQFEYRTPSIGSGYSSPRTTRSSPKQFIADTPFVPFVHQSLSKTVWQSEEIIPEEKEDIDRKQSQTQMPRKLDQYGQINQQKVTDETPLHSQQPGLSNLYPDLPQPTSSHNEAHIDIQRTASTIRNFQQCGAISISVPAEEKALAISQISQVENKNLGNQALLKQETNGGLNAAPGYQVINMIQHNQYVSRAPMYYEETKKQIAESNAPICVEEIPQKKRNLSFSYIECISVKPVIISTFEYQQQTSSRVLTKSPLSFINVPQTQKNTQSTQIQKVKLKICNHLSDQIKSTKKHDCHSQTAMAERLKLISQTYEQKIGIPRLKVHSSQQASVRTSNYAQQTPAEHKKLGISQQVNFSVVHNYEQHFDDKIGRLENYIKNIYESKEEEIKALRSKKSVDKQINTQHTASLDFPVSNQKKPASKISIRNFSTQYDPKDFEKRPPSIKPKRVSIADTKIIYEIVDSANSTETFQQTKSSRRKGKEKVKDNDKDKDKDKEKSKQIKVELRAEDEESQFQVEQTRKSKRKPSKTPKKKKPKH